ncbi:MAG: VWA domain-containing protein [Mesorhizobium sp.]|uniref:pilus assembly protein n=1 Tax=Mesorhizobium sp. TaxID=1871066 RepID=UPI000FE85F70|nr:pilus assembly protein [Mesorhizobium sp.]RWM22077.1 MAG: VWA domain-containing protein [Mesorhizobium sp.]TIP71687.1 MAG: VWA domain-containing protein [Mesorhizobium sp.]TIQ08477.1 MAG: VWA domain-containing protein [Mesorhizobium sp.]TIR49461.1 MAG: VWA domain-containing protein [Mesorhizobium sp.]TJV96090.1 MAG: VWA domain-containing protein [Mesorhizobium sp.]
MRHFGGLFHAIGSFAGDRSGNLAVLFGMVASVLALGAGFAVNVSQLYNAKSSLQGVVDAAVTSTARDLTTGVIKEADANRSVQAFLDANSRAGILQADRIVLDKLTVDRTAKTVQADVHVDVGLYFPLFSMGDMKRVAASTTALYSDKTIEVAMMLDVTGSMAGQKIKDLKTAAANAVDSFLNGQDPAKPRVRVSLVPYANSVNAGALAASSVYVETLTSQRKQAPGNGAVQYVSGLMRPDNCATERKGTYQYSDAGPNISMVNRDYLLSTFALQTGTAACPTAALKPLTADAAALKNVIKNFVASGGTAGHIGVQWTWYMLSENWGSVMKASQRPAKADPKKVAKVAILMTDGEFNLSYFDASIVDDVYKDAGKEPPRTAAKKLCAAMRDKGIEIFTIGFDLNETNAKATLQDCASPDTAKIKHFYQAANGIELNQAFQDIARNIESLALTK